MINRFNHHSSLCSQLRRKLKLSYQIRPYKL
jgi:hypothetical protein